VAVESAAAVGVSSGIDLASLALPRSILTTPVSGLTQHAPGTLDRSMPSDLEFADDVGIGISKTYAAVGTVMSLPATLRAEAAPWELGPVTAPTSITPLGSEVGSTARTGFVHGPVSNTSTAAQASGVIQFVTPTTVTATAVIGGQVLGYFPVFGVLTLRLAPEPSVGWLLASGVCALAGLQRLRSPRSRS
jgi:hypothetical protein